MKERRGYYWVPPGLGVAHGAPRGNDGEAELDDEGEGEDADGAVEKVLV